LRQRFLEEHQGVTPHGALGHGAQNAAETHEILGKAGKDRKLWI